MSFIPTTQLLTFHPPFPLPSFTNSSFPLTRCHLQHPSPVMASSTPSFDLPIFLRHHWNKKPAFLPRHLPTFKPPLTPDELAGLSCEPDSNARIIVGKHPGPFKLLLGPFAESTFQTLPENDWTLLVHNVNRAVPPLSWLMDQFSFIPNWRVDDVMVSYAATGGSVGPHVDNYDVFLVQGSGRRLWKVGYHPISEGEEHLLEGSDVRVLKEAFEVSGEWILEEGDVLYVPPRFPHHGISMDQECMTYSVGFRAPTIGSLVLGWVEHVCEGDGLRTTFYQDGPDDLVKNTADCGRISKLAVDKAWEMVMEKLKGDQGVKERFGDWFAKEVSQPKRFSEDDLEEIEDEMADELVELVLNGEAPVKVYQQEGSVFTYLEGEQGVSMYIDGERWPVESVEVAKAVCNGRSVNVERLADVATNHPGVGKLLKRLLLKNLLYTEEEDAAEDKDV